jgi:hypothetical protein
MELRCGVILVLRLLGCVSHFIEVFGTSLAILTRFFLENSERNRFRDIKRVSI